MNNINAFVKHSLITVGNNNPITGAFLLLSGTGVDTTATPFGVLYLRCLNLFSSSYDSRIFEVSTCSLTTANGQGSLMFDAKKILKQLVL